MREQRFPPLTRCAHRPCPVTRPASVASLRWFMIGTNCAGGVARRMSRPAVVHAPARRCGWHDDYADGSTCRSQALRPPGRSSCDAGHLLRTPTAGLAAAQVGASLVRRRAASHARHTSTQSEQIRPGSGDCLDVALIAFLARHSRHACRMRPTRRTWLAHDAQRSTFSVQNGCGMSAEARTVVRPTHFGSCQPSTSCIA